MQINKMCIFTPEGDYYCVAAMDEDYEYMVYTTKDGESRCK